jgi:hypothetical protein
MTNTNDIAAAFFAENAGYEVLWVEDDEPAEFQEEDGSWNSADASVAVLRDSNGTVLASRGGIIESDDYAERRNYRRVVAAELASEAVGAKSR